MKHFSFSFTNNVKSSEWWMEECDLKHKMIMRTVNLIESILIKLLWLIQKLWNNIVANDKIRLLIKIIIFNSLCDIMFWKRSFILYQARTRLLGQNSKRKLINWLMWAVCDWKRICLPEIENCHFQRIVWNFFFVSIKKPQTLKCHG